MAKLLDIMPTKSRNGVRRIKPLSAQTFSRTMQIMYEGVVVGRLTLLKLDSTASQLFLEHLTSGLVLMNSDPSFQDATYTKPTVHAVSVIRNPQHLQDLIAWNTTISGKRQTRMSYMRNLCTTSLVMVRMLFARCLKRIGWVC